MFETTLKAIFKNGTQNGDISLVTLGYIADTEYINAYYACFFLKFRFVQNAYVTLCCKSF